MPDTPRGSTDSVVVNTPSEPPDVVDAKQDIDGRDEYDSPESPGSPVLEQPISDNEDDEYGEDAPDLPSKEEHDGCLPRTSSIASLPPPPPPPAIHKPSRKKDRYRENSSSRSFEDASRLEQQSSSQRNSTISYEHDIIRRSCIMPPWLFALIVCLLAGLVALVVWLCTHFAAKMALAAMQHSQVIENGMSSNGGNLRLV